MDKEITEDFISDSDDEDENDKEKNEEEDKENYDAFNYEENNNDKSNEENEDDPFIVGNNDDSSNDNSSNDGSREKILINDKGFFLTESTSKENENLNDSYVPPSNKKNQDLQNSEILSPKTNLKINNINSTESSIPVSPHLLKPKPVPKKAENNPEDQPPPKKQLPPNYTVSEHLLKTKPPPKPKNQSTKNQNPSKNPPKKSHKNSPKPIQSTQTKQNDIPDSECILLTRELLSKLQSTILFGDSNIGITLSETNSQLSQLMKPTLKQFIQTISQAIQYQSKSGYLEQKKLNICEEKYERALEFNKEMKTRLRKIDACFDNSNVHKQTFSSKDVLTYTQKLSTRIKQLQALSIEIQNLQIENLKLTQSLPFKNNQNSTSLSNQSSGLPNLYNNQNPIQIQNAQLACLELEINQIQQEHRALVAKSQNELQKMNEPIEELLTRIEQINRRILIEKKPVPRSLHRR